jgi:hypothetical protein
MRNGIKDPSSFSEATAVINEYACSDDTDWIYSTHSSERSEERGICTEYIREALENGQVIAVLEHTLPSKVVQYRYKVSHRTQYGDTVVITVVPKAYQLIIITEW